MKKLLLTLAAVLVTAASLSAQEEKEVKTGWSFGVLPCATFSSDNGLQYGAFGDVYYYGDGQTYPDPLHKVSWEFSHFTKGRTRAYLAYDSKYLIPKMRINDEQLLYLSISQRSCFVALYCSWSCRGRVFLLARHWNCLLFVVIMSLQPTL